MLWLREQVQSVIDRCRHWIAFTGVRRLIGASVSTVVAVGVGWWLLRSPAPPIETSIARVTTTASTHNTVQTFGVSTTAPSTITVHVAGAVNSPGVYVLPSQSRVVDAVEAAGGATRVADVDAINLALPLLDSEQVVVPRRGQKVVSPSSPPRQPSGSARGTPNDQSVATTSVNINTASATELESLPGVGPTTAQAIITHRTTVAPFSSVDDLLQVSGIGPAKLEAMRVYVSL
jgi:competence protein ComEA